MFILPQFCENFHDCLEIFTLNLYQDREFIFSEQNVMSEQELSQNPQTNDTQNDSAENTDSTTSELEALIAKIEGLENDVKEAKEAQARANAESYNAQRRMEQETDKAKKFALQKFAKELLDVVDNLERAIANITDDATKEGVELTYKSLLGVLEKNGVVAVGAVGDAFNPDVHEAVGVLPDTEKDVIGQVLQKGYTLNERTLRPAMVMVGA